MRVIRSYWKDLPEGADTLSEIPQVPLFNEAVYVYGEGGREDIPELESRGYVTQYIETEMYHENVYGRKLITLTMGLHQFGEVLMLDWDCQLVKPLDAKFQEYMAEKPTQIPLYMHNIQNPYNSGFKFNENFAQPNAGFVYTRDQELGARLIELQVQNDIQGMADEWAMALYHETSEIDSYIDLYHPKVCYGVDKDFYLADPETEHSKLQLPLMEKVEEQLGGMDIYFKHK